jgi:hypothetical protein
VDRNSTATVVQTVAGVASSSLTQRDAMSAFGPTSSCLPGDLTDEAYKGDLAELGWKGKYAYDDPEVVTLRVSLPLCYESLIASGAAVGILDG